MHDDMAFGLSPAPRVASHAGMADALRTAFDGVVLDVVEAVSELTLIVKRDALAGVLRGLRDDFAYQQLMEIAGVDYPARADRFEVAYHLLSVTKNHRLRVKVSTDEMTPVPTVTHLWPNAGWLEREVFDLYGVVFAGNLDLRRILTDYGFEGYPLRKDFPLTGYIEMRYSEAEKRVVYEPVKLAQDFRSFDFMSPWEGADYVLPGDEKAGGTGEAPGKGAPTPQSAQTVRKEDEARVSKAAADAKAATATPKTTEKPADTGAGKAANKEAAKDSADNKEAPVKPARKPRAKKTDAETATKAAPKKPRAPRKPKGDDA